MNGFRYVTLDPTGNITCLVLDETAREERGRVTAALMSRCEQVGYLEKPHDPSARARLQMMGGEFCGNAAMAAAAYLAQQNGAEQETVISLEVSGAAEVISCRIRPAEDGFWEGTVEMPPVLEMMPYRAGKYAAELVRLEGIAHLIIRDIPLEQAEAETLLRTAAQDLPDPSVGLLQWNSRTKYMKPLVFVRKSDTLVWETGCGSGSTAVGAWLASLQDQAVFSTEVHQPGGTIRVDAEQTAGRILHIRITGKVRIGKMETLSLRENR